MKEQPLSIPRQPDRPRSMDYRRLKQEGIDLAQQLSGDRWTDYNEHDPGVTLLEELCYTLTELGYKTHLPLEDLLFAQENGRRPSLSEMLIPAPEALSAAPLTREDYRRLIIDAIPEVKNAWLTEAPQSEQGLHVRGLYEVQLQLHDHNRSDSLPPEQVVDAVRTLLHRHRNLGEDFGTIHVLRGQPVTIFADLQIDPNEVGEAVVARVIRALADALAPPVPLHAYTDLHSHNLAHLFEGPLPRHGWIDAASLDQTPLQGLRLLRKSALLETLKAVPGVRQVSNLDVNVEGRVRDEEFIQISEDPLVYPVLDEVYLRPTHALPHEFPLGVFMGNVPYPLDHQLMLRSLRLIDLERQQDLAEPFQFLPEQIGSSLSRAELMDYYSLQYTLPENYGVGEVGLPQTQQSGSMPEQITRRAYTRQLKGYLMLMEQLMVDYLSRLGHVYQELSLRDESSTALPSRSAAAHIPNPHVLLNGGRSAYDQALAKVQGQFEARLGRKSRVLDYLTGLFGEEFLAGAFNQLNQQAASLDEADFQARLMQAKALFLDDLIPLTRNRGQGVNYQADYHYQQPPSLQKKINLLFNLSDQAQRQVAGLHEDPRLQEGTEPMRAAETFSFSSAQPEVLAEVLSLGTVPEHFRVLPSRAEPTRYGLFFRRPNEQQLQEVYTANTQQACIEALDRLQAYLQDLNHESEGFYLLEHILLRPLSNMQVAFALTDQGRRLLLSPARYRDAEEKEAFIEQVRSRVPDPDAYQVVADAQERFTLQLLDAEGNLLGESERFIDRSSTEQLRRKIQQLVDLSGDDLAEQVRLVERGLQGAAFSDDPYSLQMSAVLPGWPARMQDERLREVLRQIMAREAPAHLHIHLHWVSPAQMFEFEGAFAKWQQTKAERPPRQPRLDQLSYYLLLLLRSFGPDDADEAQALFLTEELDRLRSQFDLAEATH